MRVPQVLHTGIPGRLLLTGLLGTTLLAVGGVGAGAVPNLKDAIALTLHLTWLHDGGPIQAVCTVLVFVGMVLLVSSWWQLRRLLDQLSPRAVLLVAALWSLPLLLAPPLFSRDVYAYAGQGNLVAHHIDPYTYGPGALTGKWVIRVDGVWRFTPAPYGPVWLWLSGRVVVLVGDHVVAAVILLRMLAVAGLLLVAWALPKLARAHGVAPQRALWLGLANPFVLLHGVAGAHNDTVMIGLLACGLAVAGSRPTWWRLVAASALVTTAALVKLPAAAALGFLPMLLPGWGRRLRAGLVVAVTAAATAVLTTTATGLGWGWLHNLDAGSARLSIFSPATGLGVAIGSALQAVGLVHTPAAVVRLVIAGSLVVAGVLALGLLLRSHHVGPLRALGLTLVGVVALGPVVQPWYLLWGLVLLAAVAGERVVLALAALSVALCLSLLPNGRSLVRPPLYGAPLVAAAALAAFEVRRSTRKVLDDTDETADPVEPVDRLRVRA
ncbi:MAG: polyprenol phosphomannose-dependent alpha 1,6 mannosyltransferase MptB [Mycobacteriales bacterium]